jgi:lactate dehydrogenase-like 2-hydroxyacid dehydrogenase
VLTETTADLAFALLMAAARRIPESVDYVRAGRWKTWGPMLLMGVDVHGATLGIVGFGRIGREMARRGRGFGMRIVYHDVHPATPEEEAELGASRVDMDELLRTSDFISLHVNLTDETHHLIDADALGAMKPNAVLVNTSRGPVVDPAALEIALRTGQIFAAGLDVTEPEPLPVEHPLVGLPNCVVVPHIASASKVTRGKMAAMAAANLLAGLRGERLPTCINPEVYG